MRAMGLALVGVVIGTVVWLSVGVAENKAPRSAESPAVKAAVGQAAKTPVAESKEKNADAEQKTETAVFAGGCFWCTEVAFEQLKGVTDVESGYCGGTEETANYEVVHLGTTDHAEVIRVTYDPDQVTYNDLLKVFFNSHDPTQLNRQGADEGRQYRSAIFYANEEQKEQAKARIADLESKRVFKRKIVTKLEPLEEFYPAEDYHQDFARRNPYSPYIQGHALPKAQLIRKKLPELIRKDK